MISIKSVQVGTLQTNCYLLTDSATGSLAVVDPGEYTPQLENVKPDYILLTHGHYDHIAGVDKLIAQSGAKLVIGKKDAPMLSSARLNLSSHFSAQPLAALTPDITLCDGDKLMLGETEITYIETPGHTAGSGCYIFDDCIISGDTLFWCSIGRTDFETGSMTDMLRSLAKLRALDGDYRVFPGHGPATTLEYERRRNPYMRENGYEDIY